MNVVIPAAGLGSRFSNFGFKDPKPFIPVKGKPMIEHVIENLTTEHDKIYVILRTEHLSYWEQTNLVNQKNICLIPQRGRLDGAIKSVLLAEQFIDTNEPLLIANSDQWVVFPDKEDWRHSISLDIDGQILTFNGNKDPKWSYAKLDVNSKVVEVAEKDPISNYATAGVYYFRTGRGFVNAAYDMMAENFRVNNEFYVCPVFNWYIKKFPYVYSYFLRGMYGMGTPEDLNSNYHHIGLYV